METNNDIKKVLLLLGMIMVVPCGSVFKTIYIFRDTY